MTRMDGDEEQPGTNKKQSVLEYFALFKTANIVAFSYKHKIVTTNAHETDCLLVVCGAERCRSTFKATAR